MKLIFRMSFIFLIYSQLTYSQWTMQNSPVASNLWSVYFHNSDTGHSVGGNGLIIRTTDGG